MRAGPRGHAVRERRLGDDAPTLCACAPRALRLDPQRGDPVAMHLLLLERAFERAREFDVIHAHLDYLRFRSRGAARCPCVTTLHGRLDLPWLPLVTASTREQRLVSISDAQRGPLPLARWVGTVHHGLPRDLYRFHARPRALPRVRGPDLAREARRPRDRDRRARGRPAADRRQDRRRATRRTSARTCEPLLDHPLVEFVGELGDAQKDEFLGNAAALLFPIDWPEPFGLIMIEALACGTPVIAWPHGSVPEVLERRRDGLRSSTTSMPRCAAVREIERIDRRALPRASSRRASPPSAWRATTSQIYERARAGSARRSAPGARASRERGSRARLRDRRRRPRRSATTARSCSRAATRSRSSTATATCTRASRRATGSTRAARASCPASRCRSPAAGRCCSRRASAATSGGLFVHETNPDVRSHARAPARARSGARRAQRRAQRRRVRARVITLHSYADGPIRLAAADRVRGRLRRRVRGARRAARAPRAPDRAGDRRSTAVELGYTGLDGVDAHDAARVRSARPRARARARPTSRWRWRPAPAVQLAAPDLVRAARGEAPRRPGRYAVRSTTPRAPRGIGAALVRPRTQAMNAWLRRSAADLAHVDRRRPRTGRYPYAGVPWFCTPFGRDALITAYQTLWLDPVARARRAALPRRHQADARRTPNATPSRARSSTRCAAARWPRSARSRSGATTAASTRRRCS